MTAANLRVLRRMMSRATSAGNPRLSFRLGRISILFFRHAMYRAIVSIYISMRT
jgi:hypothetical protein